MNAEAQKKALSRKELLKVYAYVGPFRCGLAKVYVSRDNVYFHIHPNGEPAYKERYESVGDFNSATGRAHVFDGHKWFIINTDGTVIS